MSTTFSIQTDFSQHGASENLPCSLYRRIFLIPYRKCSYSVWIALATLIVLMFLFFGEFGTGALSRITSSTSMEPLVEQDFLQLVLMHRNEMPILRDWVLYHGSAFGFRNIHIFDGSTEPSAIAFLDMAERDLGITVTRTQAGLDELIKIINEWMIANKHKSDFMLKLDTDELLFLIGDDGKIKFSRMELLQYLGKLSSDIDGHMYGIGYIAGAIPPLACNASNSFLREATVFTPPVKAVAAGYRKTIFPSRTFVSMDLGSHGGVVNVTDRADYKHETMLGVLHYHNSVAEMLDKLTATNFNPFHSSHKVQEFVPYLRDPIKSKADYQSMWYGALNNPNNIIINDVQKQLTYLDLRLKVSNIKH